jgi:two-component system nitrogen regulation sensor histidine kinase NtrY
MAFNSYYLNILLRILLISATNFGFFYFLVQQTVCQLGSGIMAWNNEGKVELVNRKGMKFFDILQLETMQQLKERYPGTRAQLEGLAEGRRTIITLAGPGVKGPFVCRSTGFLLGEKTLKLVSFQNIDRELEEHEMVSWEKLIRVLSHEVSNSVTPITTLGANIKNRMASVLTGEKPKYELEAGMAKDIQRSADLIEQRGLCLIDFVAQ